MRALVEAYQPDVIMHLAAESHVDRSIDGPGRVRADERGRHLHAAAGGPAPIGAALTPSAARRFRFHHISTDEVFGSLGEEGFFHEEYPYQPNSPYSASKAASDHFVRAWHHTYGLPTLVTNCSNNYGPYHFPEKLIPLDDPERARGQSRCRSTARARTCATGSTWTTTRRRSSSWRRRAGSGENYNIGGWNERTNIDVVRAICALVDELAPERADRPAREADHLRGRSARAMICATPSTPARSSANWAGARPRPSRPACARRWHGISTTGLVGAGALRRLPRRAARRRRLAGPQDWQARAALC